MVTSEETLNQFRAEIVDWLERACPESRRGEMAVGAPAVWGGQREVADADGTRWLREAAGRGFTAPTWPVEYGGAGLSAGEAAVLAEEMRRLRVRPPIVPISQGLRMLGPVLLEYGTEEQKRRFLPPIARGELRWCQGFSEPSAGSDLANISTRARLDHDHFLVNGHKIWSSFAHVSDWIFCLVRTDPDAEKHRGISLLLIDLGSPGVIIEPITLISGVSDFCEVFLNDVVVPSDQLVGGAGQGWTIAKRLLQHERMALGSAGSALAGAKQAGPLELARRYLECGQLTALDPLLKDQLAQQEVDRRQLKATARRYREENRVDDVAASLLKLVSTETHMRTKDLTLEILSVAGVGWEGGSHSEEELDMTRGWLRSRANSIEGGTSEIQLNILARRGLHLSDGNHP